MLSAAHAVAHSTSWRLTAGQLSGNSSGAPPPPQPKEHLLFGRGKLGAGIPWAMNSTSREPAQTPLPTVRREPEQQQI